MAYTANIDVIQNAIAESQTTTYDYLRPNAFRFSLKDLPKVSFTCQSANLPDLQLGYAVQNTPFVDLPTVGDKINFGEFTIRFIVAEDMRNYLELYRWIIGLGFPKDYSQFKTSSDNKVSRFPFVTKRMELKRFWHTRMVR